MSNNITGDMPDLPIEQRSIEQRRVIKFWIDHCHNLEEKNQVLKKELAELRSLIPECEQVENI
jgi:hypothetical protein